jgi:hypothetical protein
MPMTIERTQAVAFVLIPLAVGCELLVGPPDDHTLFPGESDATAEHQIDGAAADSPGVEVAPPDAEPSDAGARGPDADASTPGIDAGAAQDATPDSVAARSASCAPQCGTNDYGSVTLCDPSDPASITQCAALDAGRRQLVRAPLAYYACQ